MQRILLAALLAGLRQDVRKWLKSLEARVGFEPTNGGFADPSWISILLVRLAFTPAHLADFGPD